MFSKNCGIGFGYRCMCLIMIILDGSNNRFILIENPLNLVHLFFSMKLLCLVCLSMRVNEKLNWQIIV